jgi:hypothetical protein
VLSYLHRAPSLINLDLNKKKSSSNSTKNGKKKSENSINDDNENGNNNENSSSEFLRSLKNVLTADDVDAVVVPVSAYLHTFRIS